MKERRYSKKEIEKASKFTEAEIKIINETLGSLADAEVRLTVLIGLAAHCIDFISYDTGIPTDKVVEIVRGSVEYSL